MSVLEIKGSQTFYLQELLLTEGEKKSQGSAEVHFVTVIHAHTVLVIYLKRRQNFSISLHLFLTLHVQDDIIHMPTFFF